MWPCGGGAWRGGGLVEGRLAPTEPLPGAGVMCIGEWRRGQFTTSRRKPPPGRQQLGEDDAPRMKNLVRRFDAAGGSSSYPMNYRRSISYSQRV